MPKVYTKSADDRHLECERDSASTACDEDSGEEILLEVRVALAHTGEGEQGVII